MEGTKISQIYDDLLKLDIVIEFNAVPTPSYIQEKIIQCASYNLKVEKYFIEVTRELSIIERSYNTEKLNLEMLRRNTLINNEQIKRIPTGKEREAAVDELLEENHRELLALENDLNDLNSVLSAIKQKQSTLKSCNADIKSLVKLMEQQVNRLNIGHPDDPDVKDLAKTFADIDKMEEEFEEENMETSVSECSSAGDVKDLEKSLTSQEEDYEDEDVVSVDDSFYSDDSTTTSTDKGSEEVLSDSEEGSTADILSEFDFDSSSGKDSVEVPSLERSQIDEANDIKNHILPSEEDFVGEKASKVSGPDDNLVVSPAISLDGDHSESNLSEVDDILSDICSGDTNVSVSTEKSIDVVASDTTGTDTGAESDLDLLSSFLMDDTDIPGLTTEVDDLDDSSDKVDESQVKVPESTNVEVANSDISEPEILDIEIQEEKTTSKEAPLIEEHIEETVDISDDTLDIGLDVVSDDKSEVVDDLDLSLDIPDPEEDTKDKIPPKVSVDLDDLGFDLGDIKAIKEPNREKGGKEKKDDIIQKSKETPAKEKKQPVSSEKNVDIDLDDILNSLG